MPPQSGRVARYAWVRDYHRVMKRRMREFVRVGGARVGGRDRGPLVRGRRADAGPGGGKPRWHWVVRQEHEHFERRQFGSWVFLGQVITDLELEPDAPLKKSCGSCVRCIEDCPTGAIVAPYVVDNARCISYLTIENRGRDSPRASSADAGLGLRLRHLPGRLPGQPQGATCWAAHPVPCRHAEQPFDKLGANGADGIPGPDRAAGNVG